MSSSSAIAEEDRATLAQHRAVLNNKRNFLPVCDSKLSKRRAVSVAITELLVILDYCTVFATLYVQGIAGGNVSNRRF